MDSNFKIKFVGEKHQIDANVLVNNLIHTTTIIQEINRNLDSGKKIEIKINALEKGSFLIDLDLIGTTLDSLKNLLTLDNLELAGEIITAFVGLIELKKFLRGKEPKYPLLQRTLPYLLVHKIQGHLFSQKFYFL